MTPGQSEFVENSVACAPACALPAGAAAGGAARAAGALGAGAQGEREAELVIQRLMGLRRQVKRELETS